MLALACGGCGKAFGVRPEWAGKQARCPHCGTILQIPADGAGNTRSHASDPHEETTGGNSREDRALYDFLAPPQCPGEIGRLGPYRVLKVLGAGGMGVVYQAEDPQLRRLVALTRE